MTEKQVVALIRKEVERAGTIRAAALSWGVTPAYVSFILSGDRKPGEKILKAMGLRRVKAVTYTAR